MNLRHVVVLAMSVLILSGCFTLATTTGELDGSKEESLRAGVKVAEKLGWEKRVGPVNAQVEARVSPFYGAIQTVPNADLFVFRRGTNPLNNTGTVGAITLEQTDNSPTTSYIGIFATPAGDAGANGFLYRELIRQQLALKNGTQQPFVNNQKSGWAYTGLTLVSPILSARYAIAGNPLISRSAAPYLYIQNGLGDAFLAGLVISGLTASDSNEGKKQINAGIAIGLLWRLFCLINLTDIGDYNALARTDYNLSMIRP